MTNDEIKELLRELKKTSEQEDAVRSRKVRITFGPEESADSREDGPEQEADASGEPEESGGDEPEAGEPRESFLARLKAIFAALLEKLRGLGKKGRAEAAGEPEETADGLQEDQPEEPEEPKRTRKRPAGGEQEEQQEDRERPAAGRRSSESSDVIYEDDVAFMEELGKEKKPGSGRAGSLLRRVKGALPKGSGSGKASREAGAGSGEEPAEDSFADLGPETQEELTEETLSGAAEEAVSAAEEAVSAAEDAAASVQETAAEGSSMEDIDAIAAKSRKKRRRNAWGRKIRNWFADRAEGLAMSGIGRKEIALICSGLVLVALLIFLAVRLLGGIGKSSENVTADEGLAVVVTEEPREWCATGPVKMTLKTTGTIQTISVNGTDYAPQGGKKAKIEVQADTNELDIMVVTNKEVLSAKAQIAMIDSKPPTVTISESEGQAVLNAADDSSGVAHVYVGSTQGMSEIPVYEEYTGPFPVEEGKIYYYYAEDIAGNRSVPAMSSMEAAESLALSDTGLSLFPGDSEKLVLTTQPALGFTNDLRWSNSNESVVRLDADGTVTALEKGIAVVQVTAAGLSPVTCTVAVTDSLPVTISAVGDCTLGTDVTFGMQGSFNSYYDSNGSSYFFRNVADIFADDDVTFANFEGTLTTLDSRAAKQYAFKGDPAYAKVLTDGNVEAVTLANNHSRDYGDQSLADTQAALDAEGIEWCIGPKTAIVNNGGIRIGLIGIYLLDSSGQEKEEQLRAAIEDVRERGARIVVIAFHWGSELQDSPDMVQTSFGHLAVDLGADLVVGHHPHVLQGIEIYKGKTIAYSLGNFCFGGNSNPSDKDTIIFRQSFTVTPDGAVPGSIKIIPCSISSEPYTNNYQPTPAEGAEAERIMKRLNERSAQFGQSFSL